MKKINLKALIVSLALPLAAGTLSGLISRSRIREYASMEKPALSPAGWLFPVVWTILYVLMGIASYLVCESYAKRSVKRNALTAYGVQLFLNFFWSPIFFNLNAYLFALIWLGAMLAAIIVCVLLVAAIYLGQQVYEGLFVADNVSNLSHILGGCVGALIG